MAVLCILLSIIPSYIKLYVYYNTGMLYLQGPWEDMCSTNYMIRVKAQYCILLHYVQDVLDDLFVH